MFLSLFDNQLIKNKIYHETSI